MKKILLVAALLLAACSSGGDNDNTEPGPSDDTFAKGADVSWITQLEGQGRKFYTSAGVQQEGMALLRSLGMNSVRLRVWVDPADGWCGKQDVLAKALRAKALGMRIMIDFHYSDSWADPGKQSKPAAWADMDMEELKAAVAAHTVEVLTLLKNNGITPEWVQVGNETTNGMLWDTGKASMNMAGYAALHNAGYEAVKSVLPSAKVIVHIDNGFDNELYRWILGGLKANGGKWDVTGMSLYPHYRMSQSPSIPWQATNRECFANIADMISRFSAPVMICEVGMPWDMSQACEDFLKDLIARGRKVPGGNFLGVFYWEPISNPAWNGYSLGAFDEGGKPTRALNAFKN